MTNDAVIDETLMSEQEFEALLKNDKTENYTEADLTNLLLIRKWRLHKRNIRGLESLILQGVQISQSKASIRILHNRMKEIEKTLAKRLDKPLKEIQDAFID